MSSITKHYCDRCKAEKERAALLMIHLGFGGQPHRTYGGFTPTWSREWCRPCLEEAGIAPPQTTSSHVSPDQIDSLGDRIEEILREIARETFIESQQ